MAWVAYHEHEIPKAADSEDAYYRLSQVSTGLSSLFLATEVDAPDFDPLSDHALDILTSTGYVQSYHYPRLSSRSNQVKRLGFHTDGKLNSRRIIRPDRLHVHTALVDSSRALLVPIVMRNSGASYKNHIDMAAKTVNDSYLGPNVYAGRLDPRAYLIFTVAGKTAFAHLFEDVDPKSERFFSVTAYDRMNLNYVLPD